MAAQAADYSQVSPLFYSARSMANNYCLNRAKIGVNEEDDIITARVSAEEFRDAAKEVNDDDLKDIGDGDDDIYEDGDADKGGENSSQ